MSINSEFSLSQIGQIAIAVANVERASEFYSHTLGLSHLFTVSNLAFFDCAGIRLMLSVPEGGEAGQQSSVIYFRVDDIQTAYETLANRGVHFDDLPHLIAKMDTYDLWMAFFRDSENNVLSIMSEVPAYKGSGPGIDQIQQL